MAQSLTSLIIEGNLAEVQSRIAARPGILNAPSVGTPARLRGRSPLQVAICQAEYEIALWLINAGADVDYMDQSPVDGWAVPVLHDAVKSAFLRARPNLPRKAAADVRRDSDAAYAVLATLLERGANPHALDSKGNTLILKAATAVNESFPRGTRLEMSDGVVTAYARIFQTLYDYGVSPDEVDPHHGAAVSEIFRDFPVARFLSRV